MHQRVLDQPQLPACIALLLHSAHFFDGERMLGQTVQASVHLAHCLFRFNQHLTTLKT